MISQQVYLIINLLMLLDGIILIVTGHIAYSISIELASEGIVMASVHYIGSVLCLMFLNNYLMGKNELYSVRRFPNYWVMSYALFKTVMLDFIILATGAILMGISPFPRSFLVPYFLLSLISFLLARLSLYYYLDHVGRFNFNAWKVLFVGSEKRIRSIAQVLEKQSSWGHQVVGCLIVDGQEKMQSGDLRNLGGIADFDGILRTYEIDEVVFALPGQYPVKLEKLLRKCEEMGIAIKIVPSMFDPDFPKRLRVESLLGVPALSYYSGNLSASGWFYKRLLDILGGIVGCLVLLVIYPIVGLMIKADSPGPVFFRQLRIGRNGRQFYLYKFRTMVKDAETKKEELLEI